MNDTVMACDGPFQMTKPRHIYDAVNNQWKRVPVLSGKLNERVTFLRNKRGKPRCFMMTLLKLFHDNNSPFTQLILCMLQAAVRI